MLWHVECVFCKTACTNGLPHFWKALLITFLGATEAWVIWDATYHLQVEAIPQDKPWGQSHAVHGSWRACSHPSLSTAFGHKLHIVCGLANAQQAAENPLYVSCVPTHSVPCHTPHGAGNQLIHCPHTGRNSWAWVCVWICTQAYLHVTEVCVTLTNDLSRMFVLQKECFAECSLKGTGYKKKVQKAVSCRTVLLLQLC